MDEIALRIGPGQVLASKDLRSLREKYLDVSPHLVLDLLKIPPDGLRIGDQMVHVVKDAIPMDARPSRCGITENGNIRLVVESDSFPPIREGGLLPCMSPTYSRKDIEPKGEHDANR